VKRVVAVGILGEGRVAGRHTMEVEPAPSAIRPTAAN
jgi:hypothetical protein